MLEGSLVGQQLRVAIAVARFNDFITSRLLDGAISGLVRHGVSDDDITVAWSPGSFELGLLAKKLAETGRYDVVIALGAVIRGSTAHFDYVAGEAARGVGQAAMQTGVPVIFGVLTTDTIEQAIERAGTKSGNRGYDAAVAAIEMATVLRQVARQDPAAFSNDT